MKNRLPLLLTSISISACTASVKPTADIPVQDVAGVYISIPDGETKGVVLLDLRKRNNDERDLTRNFYSAEYMFDVSGLPYSVTEDIDSATGTASIIVLSADVAKKTFSSDEISKLAEWVHDGGIIVSPKIKATAGKEIFDLFGIAEANDSRDNWEISWQNLEGNPELTYFDEEEEITYAIGRNNASQRITSTAYEVTAAAEPMACYQNGKTAVVKHRYGKGKTYTFGVEWRDVIQRSQLNKDFEAQRITSNAFEPSADIYPLFLRALYVSENPVSAWKFTVPEGYASAIILTHDCDSRTAFEEMQQMADFEKSLGINAHYFITTHHYRDPGYMSAFYNDETVPSVKALIDMGHTVGSHSIGHFPDFAIEERFPLTVKTREEYFPTHGAPDDSPTDKGITTGGSTWAEVVLSKEILEHDLGTVVKSFRPGHLVVNKLVPEAMREGGYLYSSVYNAADVLSQFPFRQRIGNDWEGEFSGVLEMPLHFSDVYKNPSMDENNWNEKVDRWLEVFGKLKGNFAPAIVLIHPNKDWKIMAEKKLIENLGNEDTALYNFEDYGKFWNNRSTFCFTYTFDAEKEKVVIIADEDDILNNTGLGIMVESTIPLQNITLVDRKGKVHPTNIIPRGNNGFVVVINDGKP